MSVSRGAARLSDGPARSTRIACLRIPSPRQTRRVGGTSPPDHRSLTAARSLSLVAMLTRLIPASARLPPRERLRRGNGHDSGAFLARQCGTTDNQDENTPVGGRTTVGLCPPFVPPPPASPARFNARRLRCSLVLDVVSTTFLLTWTRRPAHHL